MIGSRFTRIALALFFLALIFYALFASRSLILGPKIELAQESFFSEKSLIRVEGRALRTTTLLMNGYPITTTEEGAFSEPYVLAPGYNRILLEGEDRYGSSVTARLEVVYQGVNEEPGKNPGVSREMRLATTSNAGLPEEN